MRRLTSVGILLFACATYLAPSASAEEAESGHGFITVVEVSGLLDEILVDYIERSITEAEGSGARGLVVNIDSPGAVVSAERLAALAQRIRGAEVPVSFWVGPSGARALGAAAQLALLGERLGISVGASIGETGRPVLDAQELASFLGDAGSLLVDGVVGAERAVELGIAQAPAPTLGDFVVELPGFESQEIVQGDEVRREPLTVVRFSQLDLPAELFHTVASPAVTYLLLAAGLGLIVFELYTAGVGIAGLAGALSLLLASYGLWVLPVRPLALLALLAAFPAFAVDVQTGVPRLWTAIGAALFVFGSLLLFDGLSVSWITYAAAFAVVAASFVLGVPAMVRTRFSAPRIERGWLVGEVGAVETPLDPSGVLEVRGAAWKAQSLSGVRLAEGSRAKVVGVEGYVLMVEPEDREVSRVALVQEE